MKTIKDLCTEYGYSQTGLAQRFGIPLRTVQNWHGGQREPAPYVVPMMEEVLKAERVEAARKEAWQKMKQQMEVHEEWRKNHPRKGTDVVRKLFTELDDLLDLNECMVGSGTYYFGSLKHGIEELKEKYTEGEG